LRALKKGDKVVLVGFGTFEVKTELQEKEEILKQKKKSQSPHPKLLYLKQEKD